MNAIIPIGNINSTEQITRFVATMAIILFAILSPFAGGTVAFIGLFGLATIYALLAIIGWCPFVAAYHELKSVAALTSHGDHFHHGHHA